MPKTYTVKEVADILGFSTNSIYTFLRNKRINGVRFGKGKFRISEEELSRVLHLSKKPSVQIPGPQPAAPSTDLSHSVTGSEVIPLVGDMPTLTADAGLLHEEEPIHIKSRVGRLDLVPPDIFDWLVGIVSIVSGLAMFLFNTVFTHSDYVQMADFTSAIRIILITAGIGVILSSMLSGPVRGWRNVFYGILAVCVGINAILLAGSGDADGTVLYGSLGIVLFARIFIPLGGIVSVGTYLSLLAGVLPVALYAFPKDAHLLALLENLHLSHLLFTAIAAIAGVVFIVCFWVGYFMTPGLFIITAILSSLAQFAVSAFMIGLGFWSRAFYIIVLGAFTVILPIWRMVRASCSRRQRIVLHTFFFGVGMTFGLAVFAIYMLQQSLWTQKNTEFSNKITTAQGLISQNLDTVKSSLVVAGKNTDLVKALMEKDGDALSRMGKIVYESNPNIRRLVFLGADGTGVSQYPFGVFDQQNYALREYFIQAKNTRVPFVSNLIQSGVDDTSRYVVVVASPVTDAKGEFMGVITALMDIVRIGTQVQSVAVESEGEYFVLFDGNQKTLFHPNASYVGNESPENDISRTVRGGDKGVTEGPLPDGRQGLIAYATVPSLGWIITLRVPLMSVFVLAGTSVWWIFGVVTVILLFCIGSLVYFRVKYCDVREAGP